MRDYVRARRVQIEIEAGVGQSSFRCLSSRPGRGSRGRLRGGLGDLGGGEDEVSHVTFRLSHSGRALHRIYSTQSQKRSWSAIIAAFGELGGVPRLQIKYDNLTAAVKTS